MPEEFNKEKRKEMAAAALAFAKIRYQVENLPEKFNAQPRCVKILEGTVTMITFVGGAQIKRKPGGGYLFKKG